MKVLLASVVDPDYKHQITPDLGIGYVASAARRSNHEVFYFNGRLKTSFQDFGRCIQEISPEVIGFKVYFGDITNLKKCIKLCRDLNSEIKIIIGGPLPSCIKEDVFKKVDVDFAFFGEAELGFPKLLDSLKRRSNSSLAKIPALIWKDKGSIQVNQWEPVDDLDKLEMPAWDLIDPLCNAVDQYGFSTKAAVTAPIITTRGCPYPCTYCSAKMITGKRIRFRSVANIIKEIKFLMGRYGIKEFSIVDDNFAANKNFVKEFCSQVRHLGIYWTCPQGIRLSALDRNTLRLMKEAGCYSFGVGIESGSQRILDKMKRNTTIEEMRHQIKLVNSAGIKVQGFFQLGFPGETKEDIQKTITYALSLPLYRCFFNIFTPFPGTEVYGEVMQNESNKTLDLENLSYHEAIIPTGDLTRSQIKKFQRRATLLFYLKPRVLFSVIWSIRRPQQISYLLKQIGVVLLSAKHGN